MTKIYKESKLSKEIIDGLFDLGYERYEIYTIEFTRFYNTNKEYIDIFIKNENESSIKEVNKIGLNYHPFKVNIVAFSKEELKALDNLGFEIDQFHKLKLKQEISDWFWQEDN